MSLLQNSNAISEGGYNIANSLRFQSASSTYLARTPSVTGNQTKWTWSAWVKRGSLGSIQSVFGASSSSASQTASYLRFTGSDTLEFLYINNGVVVVQVATTQVFRDTSSWYHLVLTYDSTEAIASNRVKIYVNGVQVTAFGTATYPSLNGSTNINAVIAHTIGSIYAPTSFGQFFDGYQTEINFINDQALTPSSFGETDTLTGQWVAKKYTGTYGTNGFYLPFSNGTSTTTLGYDSSGNSNNWTLTNFTRSAGVSDCWMIDVPSGNSGASAVQPSSNYCTWNNLVYNAGGISFSNANLRLNYSSNIDRINIGNIATNTGKFYWEVTIAGLSASSDFGIGICKQTLTNNTWVSFGGPNVIYYSTSSGWSVYGSNIGGATGSFSNGDIVGVSVDFDANVISIYQNNTLLTSRSGSIDTTVGHTVFGNSYRSGSTLNLNCGQRSFAYTPPSGFRALCTANLPAATIKKGNQYMDATTYTGNATARSITNAAGFAPDMVWVKARSSATDNYIWDTVRGNFGIVTNSTATEFAGSQVVPNSTGFALENSSGVNANGTTYVGWQWDAGSSTVTNTNGSISSQVRANPTAGVSVVTYTGNGANATVGHGLGVAPSMIIVKGRNYTGDVQNWMVYHKTMTATSYMYLNLTNSKETFSTMWNNTSPTATVFSIGTNINVNANTYNYVAYCFAEIAGFSKFTSYTGNGSTDGVFVYLGFRPKYLMIKRTDSTESWIVEDTARSPYNGYQAWLYPNLSNAEGGGAGGKIDFLSNGFKMRNSADGGNVSGATYIVAAFAENPMANSNAR